MQQQQGEWTQCAASVKSPQASEDPEGSNWREAAAPQPGGGHRNRGREGEQSVGEADGVVSNRKYT